MDQVLHITVPERVLERLRLVATAERQPLEDVAAAWLERAAQMQTDPLEALVGSIHSESSDWADEHDKHLGAAVR